MLRKKGEGIAIMGKFLSLQYNLKTILKNINFFKRIFSYM